MKQPSQPTSPDAAAGLAETFETRSVRGTVALGRKLAGRLERGDCVAIQGPLGAGKTALVRGIATGMGLDDPRLVTSPSYVLVHEYPCRLPVYHVDLYRLAAKADADLLDLGLDEMLADGVVLIEWPQRAQQAMPDRRWRIDIEIISARGRRFTIRRIG